jgi:VIT1/CCC1 family predicted Fe2+/Mn2+ transporter
MRVSLSRALVDPPRPRLRREDFAGALAVFLVVTVTTFPIVIPFLFTSDATFALRVSNAIAIVLLFVVGWAFGKSASVRPWAAGAAMVGIGLVLVAVAMALGG